MTALTESELTFRRDLVASRPMLRRCALALTRDPHRADDLVQDTIERALRFEHTYEPGSNLQGWLSRVMKNVFMSRCRRCGVEGRVLRQLGWAQEGTQTAPAQPWLSPSVARALDALPEKIGRVVWLVDLEELSYGEAAGLLDVPVGTVMSRLHRGRKRLASQLLEPHAAPSAESSHAVHCAA